MVLRNRLCKIILFLQKHRQVAKKTSPTIFGQLEAKAIAQQIIAQGKVDEVLAEKSESVALWNQIVALSKQFQVKDQETQKAIEISCQYGRIKYALIYRDGLQE